VVIYYYNGWFRDYQFRLGQLIVIMECERTHGGVVVVWGIASINAIRGWCIGKDLLMETAMTGPYFLLLSTLSAIVETKP